MLALLSLPALATAAPRHVLLQAGGQCRGGGDEAAAAARSQKLKLIPRAQGAAALARVRAARALARARGLYTRANFAGCVALLSITEQELGLRLADPRSTRQQQAHRLLARVNLWLGVCQWAAGDPQTAATSFLRSSQLPGSPAPDPRLLPPAVVRAYRGAVVAPRQQVACKVEAPLTPSAVQVNGRGPLVQADSILVPAGTHYLVLAPAEGKRSLRLQASALGCRVQVPSTTASPRACVSKAESADAALVAGVTEEAGAAGSLVISLDGDRLALRLQRGAGKAVFERQLMVRLEAGETLTRDRLARSIGLLLGGATRATAPRPTTRGVWYTRWWVWAIVGAAVAVTATTAIVASRSDRVKVVFGP